MMIFCRLYVGYKISKLKFGKESFVCDPKSEN